MVDAKDAVVTQHFFGNFVRIADDEAVPREILIVHGDVLVTLGHGLVLAPAMIQIVLALHIRGGDRYRVVMAAGAEHFAADGQLGGERLAMRIQLRAIQIHLPGQGFHGLMRRQIPAIAKAGGAQNGFVDIGANPDGRMGFLYQGQGNSGAIQFEVRARHSDLFGGPKLLYGLQVLFEAGHALAFFDAKALVFQIPVAQRAAKDHAPARHHIHGREILRHLQRIVQRQQHDAGVQPHIRRLGHDPAKIGYLHEFTMGIGGEVGARSDGVIAQLIEHAGLLHQLLKMGAHILVPRENTALHHAELDLLRHTWPSRDKLSYYCSLALF